MGLADLKPRTWGGFWDIFGEVLVELIEVQVGSIVLDIGTGGGSVLYPLARQVGSSGFVQGVETCDHCAKATTAEIQRFNIRNAEVEFIDARKTEYEDNSFDYITAGFIGWDNYYDFDSLKYEKQDDLMREIIRLLKPNGKFGMSTWLLQEDLDWMHAFLSSYSIDCKRNYHIENEEGWRMILSRAGFQDIRIFERSAIFDYLSAEFWWKEMMDYDWLLDGENSEQITDSIKQDAFLSIKEHSTDEEKVRFKRDALFATAILKGVSPSL
ncbi:MAG: class I SAM-dependent methyltransferase [Candidatus Thorarchaeota archaeon]